MSCHWCGHVFASALGKYGCPNCLGEPEMNSPGAALSALRRTTWHICPVCGASFLALTRAKFCSNRCKQQDKHERTKRAKLEPGA
jgi:hypothetical protein